MATRGPGPDPSQIGAGLIWARKHRRLSQDQVAERLGISNSYLSLLEGGKRRLSFEKLIEFAYELDIDPLELVGRMLEHSPRRGKRYVPAIAEAVRGV